MKFLVILLLASCTLPTVPEVIEVKAHDEAHEKIQQAHEVNQRSLPELEPLQLAFIDDDYVIHELFQAESIQEYNRWLSGAGRQYLNFYNHMNGTNLFMLWGPDGF
jgi:hypothetical protein